MAEIKIRNVDENYLNEIDKLSIEKGFKSRNEFMLDLIEKVIERNEIPDHSFKALSEQIFQSKIQLLKGQHKTAKLHSEEIKLLKLYLEEQDV